MALRAANTESGRRTLTSLTNFTVGRTEVSDIRTNVTAIFRLIIGTHFYADLVNFSLLQPPLTFRPLLNKTWPNGREAG